LLEGEGDLVDRVRVIWFWIGDPVLDLRRHGDPQTRRHLVALLKVPLVAVPGDLFQSVQVQGAFWGAALGIGGVLLVLYLGVVTLAAVLVVAITRSVGRLSAGAEAVGAGRFDHRVPVRRRDQLGDLAVAFNAMTASVERMVGEVAEKERMASELELARQIQEGLLPAATLVHGPFTVHAVFEPAAEVGGDYFDFFPLAGGRLVITAGDVAGHGLPTGLVMAGVKSAVAALVAEGHRGAALLAKVNAVLRTQAERPPMVTLQAVELEPGEGVVRIVSAGHTPPMVLRPGAGVEEVVLGALPAGHRWPSPPGSRTVPFRPAAHCCCIRTAWSRRPTRRASLSATSGCARSSKGPAVSRRRTSRGTSSPGSTTTRAGRCGRTTSRSWSWSTRTSHGSTPGLRTFDGDADAGDGGDHQHRRHREQRVEGQRRALHGRAALHPAGDRLAQHGERAQATLRGHRRAGRGPPSARREASFFREASPSRGRSLAVPRADGASRGEEGGDLARAAAGCAGAGGNGRPRPRLPHRLRLRVAAPALRARPERRGAPAGRATVLSFDSLMGSGGGVVAQPILGRAADLWGYPMSYAASAAIQAVAIPFVWLARREGSEATDGASGRG
jgi:HAMP domain-containing protein